MALRSKLRSRLSAAHLNIPGLVSVCLLGEPSSCAHVFAFLGGQGFIRLLSWQGTGDLRILRSGLCCLQTALLRCVVPLNSTFCPSLDHWEAHWEEVALERASRGQRSPKCASCLRCPGVKSFLHVFLDNSHTDSVSAVFTQRGGYSTAHRLTALARLFQK